MDSTLPLYLNGVYDGKGCFWSVKTPPRKDPGSVLDPCSIRCELTFSHHQMTELLFERQCGLFLFKIVCCFGVTAFDTMPCEFKNCNLDVVGEVCSPGWCNWGDDEGDSS